MRKERVINLATAVVLNTEAGFTNSLRRQLDFQLNRHSKNADCTLDDLIAETQRLNPKRHVADEEEIMIYHLEKKK